MASKALRLLLLLQRRRLQLGLGLLGGMQPFWVGLD
jgi:hypothetical protein